MSLKTLPFVRHFRERVMGYAVRREEKHRQHITSLGRDPNEYSSQFSLALDRLKTALRAIEEGEPCP